MCCALERSQWAPQLAASCCSRRARGSVPLATHRPASLHPPLALFQIVNAEKAATAAKMLANEVKDLQVTVTAALRRKQADAMSMQEELTRSAMERAQVRRGACLSTSKTLQVVPLPLQRGSKVTGKSRFP